MGENRPVSLNSLIFSDEKGVEVFRKDYFMEFINDEYANRFIDHERMYFSAVFKMKLTIMQDMNETLTEIEIKRILRLVARHLKLQLKDVRSKSQKREFVDARRYAVMICIDRDKTNSAISQYLKLDHSTVSHHVRAHRKLYPHNPKYREAYDECSEYVLTQLNPEPRKEDGSGEIIKQDER